YSSARVLFGATGDLVAKKILPALNQWYEYAKPYDVILCLGRRSFGSEDYLKFIEMKGKLKLGDNLRSHIRYLTVEFDTSEDYEKLKIILTKNEDIKITFYLAVKPESFVGISRHLSHNGVFQRGNFNHKLIFEKPFGNNLQSAQQIQEDMLKLAEERQIYRIDHYLGKDMIRNILALRFGNRLFEESWNGRVLSSIKIVSLETAGVEERLDYYDGAGAINDMIQSHLLQLMALVAMDSPEDFQSESIRNKKIMIMKNIVMSKNELPLIGQYAGYREIAPGFSESLTETYVKVMLSIDLPQWEGTQFILETGKKLKEKRMEIIMEFEPKPLCITRFEKVEVEANQLVIQVYPKEGVRLRFNSKAPGYDFRMEPVDSEYCHACRSIGNKPEAYVKLLMDAEAGDRTLFAGFDELQLQWKIADKIKEAASKTRLMIYSEGTL
ncbi:MAG: hypothetical protein WBH44_06925, partial [Proteocatella sp.]